MSQTKQPGQVSAAVEEPAGQGQKEPVAELAFDPRLIDKLVRGKISLADFQGISKEQQYEVARVGHRLLQQGKLDRADRIFRGLVALDPRDDYFHMVVASILHQRGELDLALQGYTVAIRLNPRASNALANRAEILHALGRHDEAYQDLMKVMELDPLQRKPTTRRSRAIFEILARRARELESVDPAAASEPPPPAAVQAKPAAPAPAPAPAKPKKVSPKKGQKPAPPSKSQKVKAKKKTVGKSTKLGAKMAKGRAKSK